MPGCCCRLGASRFLGIQLIRQAHAALPPTALAELRRSGSDMPITLTAEPKRTRTSIIVVKDPSLATVESDTDPYVTPPGSVPDITSLIPDSPRIGAVGAPCPPGKLRQSQVAASACCQNGLQTPSMCGPVETLHVQLGGCAWMGGSAPDKPTW